MSNTFTEAMLSKKMAGYKKFSYVMIVIILIFTGYVGIQSYLRATRILSDHTIVQANVTNTKHWQEKGRRGRLKDIYEVSYVFNLDGRPYSSTFRTNEEHFVRYKTDGLLTVAYSNKNPSEFDRKELLLGQASLLGLASRLGIILIGAIIFFAVIGFFVKVRLKKRLGKPLTT